MLLLDVLVAMLRVWRGHVVGGLRQAVDGRWFYWCCGRGHGLLSHSLAVIVPGGCGFVSGCWRFPGL